MAPELIHQYRASTLPMKKAHVVLRLIHVSQMEYAIAVEPAVDFIEVHAQTQHSRTASATHSIVPVVSATCFDCYCCLMHKKLNAEGRAQ